METNGTFGTSDIIDYRGLGLGGYNQGGTLRAGNSVLAAEAHANGTAVKTAVDCHAGSMGAALDRLSAQNFEGRFNSAISGITDQMFRSELRGSDNLAALTAQNVASATAAALAVCEARLCCKETQCLVKEENAATRLLIVDTARQTAVDQNNINATVGAINGNANANTAAIVNAITTTCAPCPAP